MTNIEIRHTPAPGRFLRRGLPGAGLVVGVPGGLVPPGPAPVALPERRRVDLGLQHPGRRRAGNGRYCRATRFGNGPGVISRASTSAVTFCRGPPARPRSPTSRRRAGSGRGVPRRRPARVRPARRQGRARRAGPRSARSPRAAGSNAARTTPAISASGFAVRVSAIFPPAATATATGPTHCCRWPTAGSAARSGEGTFTHQSTVFDTTQATPDWITPASWPSTPPRAPRSRRPALLPASERRAVVWSRAADRWGCPSGRGAGLARCCSGTHNREAIRVCPRAVE